MSINLSTKQTITIVLIVGILFPFYINAFISRKSLLAGCSRGNVTKQVVFDSVDLAAKSNKENGNLATGKEQKIQYNKAAVGFRANADALIEANAPVAESKGSVVTDCNAAYPAPFPFNYVIK